MQFIELEGEGPSISKNQPAKLCTVGPEKMRQIRLLAARLVDYKVMWGVCSVSTSLRKFSRNALSGMICYPEAGRFVSFGTASEQSMPVDTRAVLLLLYCKATF